MARLVGNPFLIHVVIDARQDAHDLAPARVHADGRADRVHDVDGLGLAELPRPRHEGIGLRGERADRAQVHDVALQLRCHRTLEIGRDLHVLAAADGAELRHARDLGGEADAAGAMDATVHHRLDQRADVLVLDRPLVLMEAAAVDARSHPEDIVDVRGESTRHWHGGAQRCQSGHNAVCLSSWGRGGTSCSVEA